MPTEPTLRMVIALVGILSIFLGYRLFCGISGVRTGRRSTVMTNLASGALLALFGMGMLVADVRGFAPAKPSQPEWQRKSAQHESFQHEKILKPSSSLNRFV